jgi:hypothetical protein
MYPSTGDRETRNRKKLLVIEITLNYHYLAQGLCLGSVTMDFALHLYYITFDKSRNTEGQG